MASYRVGSVRTGALAMAAAKFTTARVAFTNIDEFTRECLSIDVSRKLNSQDVLCRLAELFVLRGTPEHIRSDNGPEFTAEAVKTWLGRLEVNTLFIEPGSPWGNGYCESFNSKFRDGFLNC